MCYTVYIISDYGNVTYHLEHWCMVMGENDFIVVCTGKLEVKTVVGFLRALLRTALCIRCAYVVVFSHA